MKSGKYDQEWLLKVWPLLLARWAAFAILIAAVAMVSGASVITATMLGVAVGGIANVLWQWVA